MMAARVKRFRFPGRASGGSNMITLYYYAHGGSEFGPFSAGDMRAKATAGHIERTDVVWQQGTERRVAAAKVQNLFAECPAGPPCEGTGMPAETPAPSGVPAATASGSAASGESARAAAAADSPGTSEPPAPVVGPGTVPFQTAPGSARQTSPPTSVRKKRVVSIKGAVLVSQDGKEVKFRKKCGVCGHEDSGRSTAKIPNGPTRSTFFCPSCRKAREVEIVGAG
jgi:hypothetical protein